MIQRDSAPALVTGGAGFVGSFLVESLLSEGRRVLVLDDLSTGSVSNLSESLLNSNLDLVEGSLLDFELVEKMIQTSSVVFHLAAAVGVKTIMKDPLGSLKTNFIGTENLLKVCSDYKKKVLITSTSEVYGKNESDELFEDDDRVLGSPNKYRWLYSEAKAIDESVAFILSERQGLIFKAVRLFNTVGPRQSSDFGMVLPTFIKSAITNMPLNIHGDGSQSRCFTHVKDVVRGITSLMYTESGWAETYNLGNPQEVTMLQLAKRVIQMSDSKSSIAFQDPIALFGNGFEDMQRRVPNIDKVRNHIGWTPLYGIDQIIQDSISYVRQQMSI